MLVLGTNYQHAAFLPTDSLVGHAISFIKDAQALVARGKYDDW